MPFTGTLPQAEQHLLNSLEDEIMDAIAFGRQSLARKFDGLAACKRWFGDTSPQFQVEAAEKIVMISAFLMSGEVKVEMGVGLAQDNNAEAKHFTVGAAFAPPEQVEKKIFGLNVINGKRRIKVKKVQPEKDVFAKMQIGPNFKNLPRYAAPSVIAFDAQDQFETVVHELSHIVLGTADVRDGGAVAYGAARARALAAKDPAAAKRNAENWGFFVEEFRV